MAFAISFVVMFLDICKVDKSGLKIQEGKES
jgi:hypothetical protein